MEILRVKRVIQRLNGHSEVRRFDLRCFVTVKDEHCSAVLIHLIHTSSTSIPAAKAATKDKSTATTETALSRNGQNKLQVSAPGRIEDVGRHR